MSPQHLLNLPADVRQQLLAAVAARYPGLDDAAIDRALDDQLRLYRIVLSETVTRLLTGEWAPSDCQHLLAWHATLTVETLAEAAKGVTGPAPAA